MALKFCDSFDHYDIASDFLKKWTGVSASVPGSGRDLNAPGGGQGIYIVQNNINNNWWRTVSGLSAATGGCGFWIYIPTACPAVPMFGLFDGSSAQVDVRYNGANALTVTRGGTVLATGAATFTLNTWHWVELKATINNTTGVIELKVDGASYIASTGSLNTRSTANNFFTGVGGIMSTHSGTSQIRHRGCVLWDNSGSVANDFLGPVQVRALYPSGAGNYAQWTPNSGNNYGAVQEVIANGDVNYNASSTVNQIDSFATQDAPAGSGTIFGIQHVIYAKQDGGAARTMTNLTRISSTDYVGTTVSLAASYQMLCEAVSVSPATGVAYTISEFNGAEFGYKLIS